MINIHMELTTKGQALNAKINKGDGTVALEITRVTTADIMVDDPWNFEGNEGQRQTATIQDKRTFGIRAEITVLFTNQGNPHIGEPPLLEGYSLCQMRMYALDPDEGEILYRISQFARPNFIPPATEMGWVHNPTWNFTSENASEVKVNVDPKGLATLGRIWASIESSPDVIPGFGARLRLFEVEDVPNFIPPGMIPDSPEMPGIDEPEEPDDE